jgi:hypothetical protein
VKMAPRHGRSIAVLILWECSKFSRRVWRRTFLTRTVTSRPLKGAAPTVDLVFGYKKSNPSPVLKLLLSKLDELINRASNKA